MSSRRKIKEAEHVSVPPLPKANAMRAWRNTVYQNVNSASGRPDDRTISWIRAVERPDAQPSDFLDSGKRFLTLDRKLGAALSKIATGELGRILTQAGEDAMQFNDRVARGRELLCIIFQYYSTGKGPDVVYNLNDLQAIRLKGDAIENFQNTWIMVISGLKKKPDPEVLEFVYFRQVKHFKPISEDIACLLYTSPSPRD